MKYDIAFPHLGIYIETLRNTVPLFGYTVAYYGIIIAMAMLVGFGIALLLARKTRQNTDDYYDIFIWVVIFAIIGARAYYVAFNWTYYQLRPSQILNIRNGGLAVYGGIIASIIVLSIICFVKRIKFFEVVDTAVCGLAIGQAIGRFGNFFNMEAFGTFTDNIFAMRMRYDLVDKEYVDMNMLLNKINETITLSDGTTETVEYVQAHPTFLYESFFTLVLFIILFIMYRRFKKFNGEIFATYLLGYGVIRFFIEGLRTDSLMIQNTNIRVSQVVSIICVAAALIIYIYNLTPLKKACPIPVPRLPEKKVKKKRYLTKEEKGDLKYLSDNYKNIIKNIDNEEKLDLVGDVYIKSEEEIRKEEEKKEKERLELEKKKEKELKKEEAKRLKEERYKERKNIEINQEKRQATNQVTNQEENVQTENPNMSDKLKETIEEINKMNRES